MILEIVHFDVHAGEQAAFEVAFDKAAHLLPGIPGYASHELRRSFGRETGYVLLTEWQALESVTPGFRKSTGFARWRELLAGFLQGLPDVDYLGPPRRQRGAAGALAAPVD